MSIHEKTVIIMKLNGAMLRDARDRKGIRNQDELAEKLDMTRATISRAENGGELNPETGIRICEFLGVELERVVIPRVKDEGDGDAA